MKNSLTKEDYSPKDSPPGTITLELPAACAGLRLDQALAGLLHEYSRSRLTAWIRDGRVAVDGRPAQPRDRMRGGERVTVQPGPDPEALAFRPQDIPLDVVYEDDALIVIDKPAGLVVHPGSGNWDGTLLNALLQHAPALAQVPRAGIVHRLDKDTTGLMVVAKNDRAHQSLSAQFADHGRTGEMRRGYMAFVWGTPDRPRGTINEPIDRHPHNREKMAVRQGGREAVTHWEVLETFTGNDGKPVASLLACQLETGRTHQIRVHLAHLGHPLLGDEVYGSGFRTKARQLGPESQKVLTALGRQALHAYLLVLEHPGSGEILHWESGLPEDLVLLEAALRRTD